MQPVNLAGDGPRRGNPFSLRAHWRKYAAVAVAAVVVAVAGIAAYKARSSPESEFSYKDGVVEASGPWRLYIHPVVLKGVSDDGCQVTLTDLDSGAETTIPVYPVYGESMWQMQAEGRFRLESTHENCQPNAEDGPGDRGFPVNEVRGDTDAFNPSGEFTVHVDDFPSASCQVVLKDGETGTTIDTVDLTPDKPTDQMEPGDRSSVYLSELSCPVRATDE